MARTMQGVVTSDKGDKTIVVTIRTRKTHPIYKKQYTVTSKFMAHDESNEAKVGDTVVIVETRPLSARKRFALQNITERATVHHQEESDVEAAKKPVSKRKTETDIAESPAKKLATKNKKQETTEPEAKS